MEKTYKEIREDLAKKYHDDLRKHENFFDWLAKIQSTKEKIKEIREMFINKLQSNLANEEWYEESKKSHIAEHKAKLSVIKAKEERERLKREYEEKMVEADRDVEEKEQAHKAAQIDYRWKVEEETKVKDTKEELYWDKEKILKNLKQKVVVDKNTNYMWYTWKKVHITLPEVEWKFDWFKFEYFISNKTVYKKDFESNPELENKSYSPEEVWNLLKAMNKYMQAMGVETDWDMDYEKDLKYRKVYNTWCDSWDCLKDIAWLDYLLWLKQKNVNWKINSRVYWDTRNLSCCFWISVWEYSYANLFLRLS